MSNMIGHGPESSVVLSCWKGFRMKNSLTKALGMLTMAGALLATGPAEAWPRYGYHGYGGGYGGWHHGSPWRHGYRWYHDDDDAGLALGAGIIGLALGAAIASDRSHYDDRYYEGPRSYYDDYGYERGYYDYDPYPRYEFHYRGY